MNPPHDTCSCARMAELADALASGASSRKGVEVRVLFRAPNIRSALAVPPHYCTGACAPRAGQDRIEKPKIRPAELSKLLQKMTLHAACCSLCAKTCAIMEDLFWMITFLLFRHFSQTYLLLFV